MFKITPEKRVLFVRRVTPVALALFGVFSLGLANIARTPVAHATAFNDTVNFQARLQTAAGAIVPDDSYNVEFKLYDVSAGGTALWTEDYLNSASQGLSTSNGYLSTSLGSITAFPSTINWSHKLWVTMNIGGTGTTASWDGEMNPRLELTAIPYAFQANQLTQGNSDGSLTSNLYIQAPTGGDQHFYIQDQGASGSYGLLTGNQADGRYVGLQPNGNVSVQGGNVSVTGTGHFGTAVTSDGDFQTSNGSLILNGTSKATYITPNGVTISSKISVANFDPGAYGQVIALGIPDIETGGQNTTARVITVLDGRTYEHQPSIALLSPNESNIFGLSWDGSNTTPVVKTNTNTLGFSTGGAIGATLYSGSGNTVLNVGSSGGTNGILQLTNATNSSVVNIQSTGTATNYTINLPDLAGAAGQCLAVGSVTDVTEYLGYASCGGGNNITLQNAYDNSGSNAVIALNSTAKGVAIQDASTSVGGNLFNVENNAGTTSYFSVDTTGTQTTGTQTVNGNTTISGDLGIGTTSPSRSLQVTVNNSTINAPPVLIQQTGSGDSSIEFQNSSTSFYIGQDSSNSNTFAINSSGAASSASSANYVQSGNFTNFGSGTTSTVTLSSVVSGHLLVAGFSWTQASGDTVTCSDTLGTTFTTYSRVVGSTTQTFESCYGIAPASGTDVITVTFGTGVSFRQMVAAEYSGINTTTPLDTSASVSTTLTSGTGTDNVTTPAATTTSSGDLIVGLFEDVEGNTTTATAGTGFTSRQIANTSELMLEDKNQASAGSIAATATYSNSGIHYLGAMLAFKPATAGTVSDTFNNSLFTLSQSGAANFRNSSNSTTAFRVQNASSASMFNVDTTNEKVTIGPSGGDSTGALLILGSKTTSGDPTEVDGAMYYNASKGSFRCGQFGVWVSCIGGLLTANTTLGGTGGNTVANSTTETTFATTYSIPASYCANNRVLRVTANGLISTTGSPQLNMRVKLGSTSIGVSDSQNPEANGITNKGWTSTFTIMCPNAASSNATVYEQGLFNSHNVTHQLAYSSTGGIATNGALTLGISMQWGTASASNSITLDSLIVEGLSQ